jgi:hypothetical protein
MLDPSQHGILGRRLFSNLLARVHARVNGMAGVTLSGHQRLRADRQRLDHVLQS